MTILPWIVANRKSLFKAILSLFAGLLIAFSINTYNQNKKLSKSLEMALNNIEAYLGSLLGSLLANNVLKLDIESLQHLNDKLLNDLDSVRKQLKIKSKLINTAATLTLSLRVNESKEITGNIIEILKDSVYKDSIKYNDLTTVYYTIGTDTVNIGIDLKNTLYLYIYTTREYLNKKSFFKRLFTFDFKKVNKYKYEIINTNDLLSTEDVRIIENITK